MKRISFSQSDAIHLYEYLRFYWKNDYEIDKEFWTPYLIKECGKFGGCPECTNLGVRLEKFIGEKEIKYVEKLLKKSH